MFSVNYRNRVQEHILRMARSDGRVVAGAVIGSLALDEGDRWSDLDLTFAAAQDASLLSILDDWAKTLAEEYDAAHLFDLPGGPSIYRVFLLPGCLQVDLSVTPASRFGARGPKFKLLFGTSTRQPFAEPPAARDLFGYAVHHALRARICMERGRKWQAEYWIGEMRNDALSLACLRRGLPAHHGRGFDDLPAEVLEAFQLAHVASLGREELQLALNSAITGLLEQAETIELQALASQVEPELRELMMFWEN